MKSIIKIFIIGLLVFGLVGCSSSEVSPDSLEETIPEQNQKTSEKEIPDEPEEIDTKNEAIKYQKNIGPEDAELVKIYVDFSEELSATIAGFNSQKEETIKTSVEDWQPQLPKLLELAKENEIRLEFKHFPLSENKNSFLAAQAAEEANKQGNFWQYHDLLLQNQNDLSRANLLELAKTANLDLEKFNHALDYEIHASTIQKDIQDGSDDKIFGIPTIFLKGKEFNALQPYYEIEDELSE